MQEQFAQLIQALQGLLQKKDFVNLDKLLTGVLAQYPDQLLFHQFRAASLYEQQQYRDAFETLIYCHRRAPHDADIIMNLARTCLALGKITAAATYTVQLLKQPNSNTLAALLFTFKHQLNLTPMMPMKEILGIARHCYQQQPKVYAAAVRYLLDKDLASQALEEFTSYKQSKQTNDLLLLEAQLKRATGQFDAARTLFDALLKAVPGHYAIYHSYANCLADCQDYHAAIDAYKKTIELAPDYAPAHKNLSELRFELGGKDNFLDNYQKVFEQGIVTSVMLKDYLAQLLRTRRVANTEMLLNHYRPLLSRADFIYYSAESRRLSDKPTHIAELLSVLHDINELTCDQACQLAQQCITDNELSRAAALVQSVVEREPGNQWALALIPYAAQGAESKDAFWEAWACKQNYIYQYTIEPPATSESLTTYLIELQQYLRQCHNAETAPLEQTLINGTQTRGNLFFDTNPLIVHLKCQFEWAAQKALKHYQALPSWYDGFKPPGVISAESAWSVDLKSGGYHSNHIHPMGWLSSVCYVTLPSFSDEHYDGYLNFGIPNFTVADNTPFMRVKPEAGKLVLFPSFFWHGTESFSDSEKRLTVACDFKKEMSTF